jgi:hypothetical protein
MKIERYQNKREGEKKKSGQLMFLNFKLTHNQSAENYIKLFDEFYTKDPIIPSRGEKVISLSSINKDNILTADGLPRLIYGKIATYNIIDNDGFYDREKKELVSINLGENIVSHFKYIDFYFSPSKHRLAFFANQEITSNQVHKYFKEASEKILGVGQISVNFETSRDVIERIINANYIEHYFASISYSNRDEHPIFSALIQEKTQGDNIERLDLTAKPAEGEAIIPQKDGMIDATAQIAKSNGYIVATIREGENNKRVKIDTTDHPMKEPFSAKLKELNEAIHSKIISIFK